MNDYNKDKDKEIIQVTKNFFDIKRSADQLNNNVKQQTLKIKNSIVSQETELKKLQNEEIIFNQKRLQANIIDNQKKLINEYRENNEELKFNLSNLEKKLLEKDRSFKINNEELKNTLSRYIVNYKKLQEKLNIDIETEKDSNETSLDKSKEDEIISKIKFYQDENTRLSSEIIKIKKNYETIKENFTDVENQKNDIFKKIKELNNSLIKNNIVGTPFIKETIEEDSISSKILNDITNKNLNKEKKKTEKNNNLDEAINNIFK
tara:strand:+ start:69 stop:857 length:789 start_codon:yes stop_codon:yes gene_type:complete